MLNVWEIEHLLHGSHQPKMEFMHSPHIHTRDSMDKVNQTSPKLYHKNNNKLTGTSFSMHTIVTPRRQKVMFNSKIVKKQSSLSKLITSLSHKFTSTLVKIVSIHHGVVILVNSEWIFVEVHPNQLSLMVYLFFLFFLDIIVPPVVTPTPKPPVTETKEYFYKL